MTDDSFFVVQDDGQLVTLDDGTQVTVDVLDVEIVAAELSFAGSDIAISDEAVAPPLVGEGGFGRPPPPRLPRVDGEGFGILPELEGEAHGVVLAAGAGAGILPSFIGEAAGGGTVGDSAGRLIGVRAASIGDQGEVGTATIAIKVIGSSSGAAGLRGSCSGTLVKLKGAAIGQHDNDEIAAIILLAA